MTILAKVKIWSSFLLIILVVGMLCACGSPAPEVANEGELSTYHLEIDLLGTKNTFLVDSRGRLKTSVQVVSADGTISLSIDRDTILLDKDGKSLQFIHIAIDPTLPLPPEGAYIVGVVYDLTPQGATFNPPLKLTLSYDTEELPEGVSESEVYIAPYNEGTGWGMWRYKSVDTENHRVTTQVDYFAKYAVLAPREYSAPDMPSAAADKVELVYFYRPQRCYSCLYAETATRFTVETYFENELANGKLVFRVVNLGDEANTAIVAQYGAYTSSLFINGVKDGTNHIEEVTEIWFVLGNDEAFVGVVKSEIEKSLRGEG